MTTNQTTATPFAEFAADAGDACLFFLRLTAFGSTPSCFPKHPLRATRSVRLGGAVVSDGHLIQSERLNSEDERGLPQSALGVR